MPRTFKSVYRDAWPSLFVGPAGSASGLHIDSFGSHFFMYLMTGRKHWRLFRSDDRELLHPRRAAFDVDVMCPDVERFGAELAQTQPYDALMQPGDILFVPSGSPHQVLNLDDTLAISANYFDASNWEAVLSDLTHGTAFGSDVADRTSDLREWIESAEFNPAMDMNVTDVRFLDTFKDAYYNRLLGQHPCGFGRCPGNSQMPPHHSPSSTHSVFSSKGYVMNDGSFG